MFVVWGGGHYQHMWIKTLLTQRRALSNTEAVLLIHITRPNFLELDILLNQGVCSVNNIYCS